jgi:hypothetical protein
MSEFMGKKMSSAKTQLLSDSYFICSNYLEYGMGVSTALAAQKSIGTIISIDHNQYSVGEVKTEIKKSIYSGNINLLHANLGITSENGYPLNETTLKIWPQYYAAPWNKFKSLGLLPDLILINGRLRTPCFLYSLLQCRRGTRILWNNYLNQPEYHFVEKVLKPQGLVEDMVIFVVDKNIDTNLVIDLLFQNLFNLD